MNDEMLADVVLQAKNGNMEAFEKLYAEYYGDIYFTCLKVLHSSSDAEDITQDTFIEAYNSIGSLSEPKSFKSWLNRIAVNKSLNYLKRMNRINLMEDNEITQMIDADDFEGSAEDKAIDEDVRQTIEEIMFRLPQEQRTVLYLYYYCGMTTREIAELYECPESTIKSRLTYARKFMKREIEKLEDKGYQLRCIAVLPFLFAVFKGQRNAIAVSASGSFSDVYAAKNVSSAGTNINAVKAGRKVIKLSKKAKIAIVGVAAAVVVGGGAAAVVMSGCGNSDTESSKVSENPAVSSVAEESKDENSIADEESTASEQESSEAVSEVSEESEAPKAEFTWKFREMEPPKPQMVEYVTSKAEVGDIITATPSIVIDMEAAEKVIKEYPKFSSLTFAGLENEERGYNETGNIKYVYENGIVGYSPEEYGEKFTDLYGGNVRFYSTQTYSQYNGPEEYFLQFNYSDITQDEAYELLSKIFGEEIAEYLVYCETEDGYKSDTDNNIFVSVPLDEDDKSEYIFERNLSILEIGEEFITFTVKLEDKNVSGYQYTDTRYDHFENNYTGMKLPVEISDIFDSKYGGTDLSDSTKLFDKAFSYGGNFDKYQYTSMSKLIVDTVTYSDGSLYSHILMNCYRISVAADEDTEHTRIMNADFNFMKNADGSIDVQKIDMTIPTTFHHYDQENFAKLDDMIGLTKQQVIDVLGIDKSLLEEVRGDGDFRMISAGKVPIKLFGQDIEATLTLTAAEVVNDYDSDFKIELN